MKWKPLLEATILMGELTTQRLVECSLERDYYRGAIKRAVYLLKSGKTNVARVILEGALRKYDQQQGDGGNNRVNVSPNIRLATRKGKRILHRK